MKGNPNWPSQKALCGKTEISEFVRACLQPLTAERAYKLVGGAEEKLLNLLQVFTPHLP